MSLVRDLDLQDHDVWWPLWQAYLTFYQADLPAAVSRTTWERLVDPAEPVHGALAFDGSGQAVGLVHWVFHRSTWSAENVCYLNDLFVDPSQRGQGLGRGLISYVDRAAEQKGCAKVYWLTHETNTTAQRLYGAVAERSGFIQYCQLLRR